jgi:hypothetical protein
MYIKHPARYPTIGRQSAVYTVQNKRSFKYQLTGRETVAFWQSKIEELSTPLPLNFVSHSESQLLFSSSSYSALRLVWWYLPSLCQEPPHCNHFHYREYGIKGVRSLVAVLSTPSYNLHVWICMNSSKLITRIWLYVLYMWHSLLHLKFDMLGSV